VQCVVMGVATSVSTSCISGPVAMAGAVPVAMVTGQATCARAMDEQSGGCRVSASERGF